MITKLVLSERGYASAERQTKDIDANWVGAPPSMSRLYHYGEIGIRGVLPTEILADKISVLSGRHIFRRAKDIFDVYALAHCVSATTSAIYDVQGIKGQEIGTFTEFCARRQAIGHAYEKLRGIEGKLDFDEVYAYLEGFLTPFILKDKTPMVWNINTSNWDDVLQIVGEKPSVMEQIRSVKAACRAKLPLPPKEPRCTEEPEL